MLRHSIGMKKDQTYIVEPFTEDDVFWLIDKLTASQLMEMAIHLNGCGIRRTPEFIARVLRGSSKSAVGS